MYNMNFLYASLVFLFLLLYHFMSSKRIEDVNSRIFRFFICFGIADILFDIISTMLISDGITDYSGFTEFILTIFYLLQVIVPYALFMYTWSLSKKTSKLERRIYYLCSLPALFMAMMVIMNIWSQVFFYVDVYGNYMKGPHYLAMYIYAFIYGIIILITSIVYYRQLGIKNFSVICEFLVIMVFCVGIQALRNDILMTGFGLCLGITVLYLAISNPADNTDQLTNVFNFQVFTGWCDNQRRSKKNFHLISVDLVQLKEINSLFGIDFGDNFLMIVTQKMSEILESPYIFRISGKRFLLATYSLYEYDRVRKALLDYFNGSIKIENEQISLLAVLSGIRNVEEFDDNDMLLNYIDYLVSLTTKTLETIMLQSDEKTMKGFRYNKEIERYLYVAIEQDLFEVYFQPVYSVEKQDYVTLEALSRLKHPIYGFVSPEIFIQIAEANGQITDISYLQFNKVCRFIKEHSEIMDKIENVKFNLSPAEILFENCSERLIKIIDQYELPYSYFQFEITETIATKYCDKLYQVIEDFNKHGIGLSLDDFGSGYANLDAVIKLPFSSIKLDRSLLNGILEDEKKRVFYKNIVAVLKSMGYQVIGEGVEKQKEMNLLHQWGVDMIQGYYFSKPLSPKQLVDFIIINQK